MAAARLNTPEHPILDYRVVCLAGDGCMQEGVAMEAVAFAGHQRLDNLILIYDANAVTLDAMADKTQSDDTALRFKSLGWDVQAVDGHAMPDFLRAFNRARKARSGRPQLIIARTEIGRGIPEVAGTAKGHGEGGAKFAAAARAGLGLPAEEHFYVSEDVRAYFQGHRERLIRACNKWYRQFKAWREANPERAALLDGAAPEKCPSAEELLAAVPAFAADAKLATRAAGRDVLQPLATRLPLLIGGSADLYGSTLNYIAASTDCEPGSRAGRNVRFGIREHAMAAIANGIAYDGLFRPSIATFLVFADYARPAMRLAALARLPVVYIYTHDSIGVGEDGPTHQPVETIAGLRVIPGLDLIRPADPEETAGAYAAALSRVDGPTVLALTRQVLPTLAAIPAEIRRQGALRGGYVAVRESAPLEVILLATGSEVQLVLEAARILGPGTRVVSLPCTQRFDRQTADYREAVLPASCRRRVAVEAGVTGGWYRYVGLDGRVVGIDRFGMSAPAPVAFRELGLTVEAIVAAARAG
jgi:transketolase